MTIFRFTHAFEKKETQELVLPCSWKKIRWLSKRLFPFSWHKNCYATKCNFNKSECWSLFFSGTWCRPKIDGRRERRLTTVVWRSPKRNLGSPIGLLMLSSGKFGCSWLLLLLFVDKHFHLMIVGRRSRQADQTKTRLENNANRQRQQWHWLTDCLTN